MPKLNLNELFFIKSTLLPNIMKQLLVFLCLLGALSACSRSKGYFSIHQTPRPSELKNEASAPKEPILLAIGDQQSMVVLPEASISPSAELVLKEVLSKQESVAAMPTVRLDKQVAKKEVKALIQQMKSQNQLARQSSLKQSQQASSASSWDPKLKIGLILLGLGIILSIFGLGLIGGISAFIGLVFTIIGLLHTY